MALTFPLTRAAFLQALCVQGVAFDAPRQDRVTGLQGGEVLKAQAAPQLWQGSFTLAPMRARDAAEVQAVLEALEAPGRAFYCFKPNQIGPASDPLGAALSGSTVTIKSVNQSASTLQLQGLPAGYVIRAGDLLSFAYENGRTIQALHRVRTGGTANGSGDTPDLELGPHIRAGSSFTGAAVQLVRPYCKAVLLPGSVEYGSTRNGLTAGIAFSWRQSLR